MAICSHTRRPLYCPSCDCMCQHQLRVYAYDGDDMFEPNRKTIGRGSECHNCGNFKPVAPTAKLMVAIAKAEAFTVDGHPIRYTPTK